MKLAASTVIFLAFLSALAPAQTTIRVSVDSAGQQLNDGSVWPSLSRDGRFAAFVTAAPNLVANDTNGTSDVFVKDLQTGQIVRASVTAAGFEANGPCFQAILSADGRYVAFTSWATNLAPSDANGTDTDVFVKDLLTGSLDHVSVDSSGHGGNAISAYESLSADGRYVTFYSYSTNLAPGDTDSQTDVFLHDRVTGVTELISDVGGGELSAVSGDGRFVAFERFAATKSISVRDRLLGTTKDVCVDAGGNPVFATSPVISDDGRYVAFATKFALTSDDLNFGEDVYRVSIATGAVLLATDGKPGSQAVLQKPTSISSDGRYIALTTSLSYSFFDSNDKLDAYVADTSDHGVELLSWAFGSAAGNDHSGAGIISANGRYVCFQSEATNIVQGDTNGTYDIFVRDRAPKATWLNYGSGFPGTGGVPTLALASDPVLGQDSAVVLKTLGPTPLIALGVIGTSPASTPTVYGGTLLVAPLLSVVTFALPQGISIPFTIPDDLDLAGAGVYMQFLVKDPGAAHGVAFTRGLLAQIGG